MRIRLTGRDLAIVIALWIVVASTAEAATRIVPRDFPTIQAAVNASRTGDVVIVAPGTYSGKVVISNKRLLLRSSNSHNPGVVAATIVDLTGTAGPGLEITGPAAQGTIVSGLTVRGSSAEGIVVTGITATIEYCQVRQNQLAGIRSEGGVVADNIVTGNGTDGIAISNCEAKDNSVSGNGACGIKSTQDTIIRGNTVFGNTASGIYMQGPGTHRAQDNRVTGNGDGGLVCDYSGEIIGNVICGNTAPSSAGLRLTGDGPFTVTRNLICSNAATISGGAASVGSAEVQFLSNTIVDNTAPVAGGLEFDAPGDVLPEVRNCIIAFNRGGGGVVASGATPNLSYNDVYGNAGGDYVGLVDPTGTSGNLSVDPLFANASAGDFRVKSQGGRFNGSAWIIDAVSSRCIDAGDPASAFTLEPAPNGGRINLGYDGNTGFASKSGVVIVPRVINCAPRGTGCSVAANLTVRFSTPMKQASVQNNLYINGAKVTGGTFTWVGTKMTYNPAVNFKAGRRYQVRIAKAALSRAGVKMEADKIWNFTTAAAPAAVTVTAVPTASGAQLVVRLTATADLKVSIRNLAGREVALLSPGSLDPGVHSLLWNGRSRTGTIAPSGSYLCHVTAMSSDGDISNAVSLLAVR